VALGAPDKDERGLAIYDAFVSRYEMETGLAERQAVAQLLQMKSSLLAKRERYEEAGSVCDDLVARFGEAAEPEVLDALVGRSRTRRLGYGVRAKIKMPSRPMTS
jgi:hypothetical protein